MPPGKRSYDHEPGDEENPTKKAKRVVPQRERAGTIDTISMKNFMCHNYLEVNLNKRINFIVGRNGSGKSAILSAVVVALGSKASATNRATSLKDFVKKGCNSSVIQVTLNNRGVSAYKQDVYGEKIIVSRTLNTSTSSLFKIKSERGELISTKREELQRIITAFNIQIDNPVSILNQDTSRTFLATSDPKNKYAIFMRATRLDEIHQAHLDALQIEETGHMRLQTCYDNLKHTEKEVNELEEKWKQLQKLKRCRDDLIKYENELFWARARDEEKILSSMNINFNKEKAIIEERKKEVEKLNADFEEAMDQIRSLKKDADEKSGEMKVVTEKLDEAKKEEKVTRVDYSAKLRQYRDVKEKVKHHYCEIEGIKKEIEKLKAESDAHNIARRKRIQEKLASLVKEQEMLQAIQRTTNEDYEKLQGEQYHYQESLNDLKASHVEVRTTIERKKRELASLKKQGSNLSLYGSWMEQLCRRIEDAHQKRKFSRKPLGPLGLFMKVREPRWVQAIESEIGISFLRSFFCHDANDARILREIMKEVIPEQARVPSITVSEFQDRVYNVRDKMAQCQGYITVYEMLDISDANAANCLIDNRSVEQVLLIPTHAEAAKIMSDKSRPHKNCKRCINLVGDVYYPYPDYKTYSNFNKGKSHLLQASTQDAIRYLEEEIVAEEQKLGPFEAKINELRNKIVGNKNEFQRVQLKQKEIGDKKSKVDSEIRDLQERLESSTGNIQALETELTELQNKCSKIMEEEKVLDAATKEKKAVMEAARQDVKNLEEIVNKADEERNEIMNQVLKVKEKVKRVDMKRKEAQRICESLEKKVKEAELRYQEQKEKCEKALKEAQDIHPEKIATEREIPEIEKDIKSSRKYVDMAEKTAGSMVDVTETLAAKRATYGQHIARFKTMKQGLKLLRSSLKSRKTLYYLVREVMTLKVMYLFQPLLKQRGYQGELIVDHDAKTLKVLASPAMEKKSRETKSLSGGERSYSTVAFLLALWECVETPFYFLDEFDVFMDRLNRQMVMELLMFQARQKHLYQYVFLTPQDTPSIKDGKDLTIHQLEDPERGAT